MIRSVRWMQTDGFLSAEIQSGHRMRPVCHTQREGKGVRGEGRTGVPGAGARVSENRGCKFVGAHFSHRG